MSASENIHKERKVKASSGYLMIIVIMALLAGSIGLVVVTPLKVVGVVSLLFAVFLCAGFFMVHPNQAKVLQLFGTYKGTCVETGLRWANPFYQKTPVSLRIRNFESDKLKVNDASGSPIELAAVVVWRVVDSAEAVFEVDDFEDFVTTQSESALRNLASSYPYDHSSDDESEMTLRGNTQSIAEKLKDEIQDRLDKAGVMVKEARITHLAYAPEIANAMLRRQQATAVIAARSRVVEGAVSMVEMALERLSERDIVELDDERKATMVSNLMVVLCSDRETQPVINTGTIY